MRRYVFIDLVVGFLVPLIPAVLLYELFSSLNSAEVIQTNDGIKLGGPAALYVVLLVVALRIEDRWLTKIDPLGKLKRDLVGTWDVTSVSSSGSAAVSTSSFRDENDDLVLVGGAFIEQGKSIGTWTPDHVIFDRKRDGVIFLYELKDVEAAVELHGLMQMTINRTNPLSMDGTWEVFGSSYHRGTVKFAKRAP